TFPYIEFRELRAIPIAVLARQDDTPELYLRELTENRRILAELPVHVRRKILQVDRQELQLLVEECTREYVTGQLEWYLNHPTSSSTASNRSLPRRNSNISMRNSGGNRKRSLEEAAGGSLWNVTSHVPSAAAAAGSSSSAFGRMGGGSERLPSYSPEERRRNNPALLKLMEMLGDSESLYLSTLEIWRNYVVSASVPGSTTNGNPKEYVDYVPLLGAMRNDLGNLQRDKTTTLLRTDPLHKFIWFMDRALKNQTLEIAQLHELLGFIGRLRTGDLPPNKKFRKKSGSGPAEEEEENFEVVLGPPPVAELLAVLDKIAKLDARLIFADPVPDDVPKYRDIIKEPMDLSTMRRKAKRSKYKTLDAFVADFNLMIRNCMTFNPDTTIFYKEGKRVGKRGNELIERNITALRGEPQRIRTKKRRKNGGGPSSEAISMLTSSGVVTIKDFGDVDQSGMIPEGLCDDLLADVALILSDPLVKQLLCDALMKNLVVCWQRRELPTDNLICRALVQLLQIGNPASVRRMIRKRDFVLRAPQVVTMRVVLPLLLRSMVGFRVYFAFPPGLECDVKKAKEDVLGAMLWDNVLRASSAIRAMAKSFAVQCIADHQIDAGAQLLQHLLVAEDELLLRDRVLLHALVEVVVEQVKVAVAMNVSASGSGDGGGSNAAENGEVTTTLSEQVQALEVWQQIVDGFFVDVLAQRIRAVKESMGSVVVLADSAEEASPIEEESESTTVSGEPHKTKKRKRQQAVKSFPVPVFHTKTAMLLSSLFALLEKGDPAIDGESTVALYLKKTLGVLRDCCTSLEEFELLWSSPEFAGCRQFYEPLLAKCPLFLKELFAAAPVTPAEILPAADLGVKAGNAQTSVQVSVAKAESNSGDPAAEIKSDTADAGMHSDAERNTGGVEAADDSSNAVAEVNSTPATTAANGGDAVPVATEDGEDVKTEDVKTENGKKDATNDDKPDKAETELTVADVKKQENEKEAHKEATAVGVAEKKEEEDGTEA
ncbi:hypothetical protein BBJ28_00024131, partial [Nothophytophthora sp. Chile5]